MTNGDRLRTLDNAGLADEMRRFASSELMRHIDLPAWLDSEKKEYPIEGREAVVTMSGGERFPCRVVGTKKVFGQPYCELVMEEDFPYQSRLLTVPEKSITYGRSYGK